MKNCNTLLMLLGLQFLFGSCKKEGMEINDEEVITTIQINLVPAGGGSPLTFAFRDLDGPGGNAPVIDTVKLSASSSYSASLIVLNETVNPADTVSNEIYTEADSHRFYYNPSVSSSLTVANLDTDTNGVELGLASTWITGNTGSGNLTITLRHYSGTPPGKLNTDPVNSPKSSTDLEVTFPILIQ